jgi:hypothetical protein
MLQIKVSPKIFEPVKLKLKVYQVSYSIKSIKVNIKHKNKPKSIRMAINNTLQKVSQNI